MKLKQAEARLTELKSSMMVLGREATAAMLSVEDEQQKITFHRLLAMVLLLFVLIFLCNACNKLLFFCSENKTAVLVLISTMFTANIRLTT